MLTAELFDLIDAATEVNEGWADVAYVEMPELARMRDALDALKGK